MATAATWCKRSLTSIGATRSRSSLMSAAPTSQQIKKRVGRPCLQRHGPQQSSGRRQPYTSQSRAALQRSSSSCCSSSCAVTGQYSGRVSGFLAAYSLAASGATSSRSWTRIRPLHSCAEGDWQSSTSSSTACSLRSSASSPRSAALPTMSFSQAMQADGTRLLAR